MTKDDHVFLKHILDSISMIEQFLDDITREDFEEDAKSQEAVVRRLEVIGEAAKHVPQLLREKYTSIPWKEIAGMRDKLIHHYFGVNLGTVWTTVKEDLPKLKEEIENILKQEASAIKEDVDWGLHGK